MALIHDLIERKQKTITQMTETLAAVANLDLTDLIPTFGHQDLYWNINWFTMHRYGVDLAFTPKTPDEAMSTGRPEIFAKFQGGYIAKTLQALQRRGYIVSEDKQPSNPESESSSMDIRLYAMKKTESGDRDYAQPSISITFFGIVPQEALDDPKCRIEYEEVEVPATKKVVAKVVCDD